jgi:hypothetical protein
LKFVAATRLTPSVDCREGGQELGLRRHALVEAPVRGEQLSGDRSRLDRERRRAGKYTAGNGVVNEDRRETGAVELLEVVRERESDLLILSPSASSSGRCRKKTGLPSRAMTKMNDPGVR